MRVDLSTVPRMGSIDIIKSPHRWVCLASHVVSISVIFGEIGMVKPPMDKVETKLVLKRVLKKPHGETRSGSALG
jgi:hypothetical protein